MAYYRTELSGKVYNSQEKDALAKEFAEVGQVVEFIPVWEMPPEWGNERIYMTKDEWWECIPQDEEGLTEGWWYEEAEEAYTPEEWHQYLWWQLEDHNKRAGE